MWNQKKLLPCIIVTDVKVSYEDQKLPFEPGCKCVNSSAKWDILTQGSMEIDWKDIWHKTCAKSRFGAPQINRVDRTELLWRLLTGAAEKKVLFV